MIIQIIIEPHINVSLQKGDLVYFAKAAQGISGLNNPYLSSMNTKPKVLGKCVSEVSMHENGFILVDVTISGFAISTLSDVMYMFEKDKRAGLSGIIGYYALTEYRNYSTIPVEMFATAVDYVESSK